MSKLSDISVFPDSPTDGIRLQWMYNLLILAAAGVIFVEFLEGVSRLIMIVFVLGVLAFEFLYIVNRIVK